MNALLLPAGLLLAFVAAASSGYLWLPRLTRVVAVRGVARRQVTATEVPSLWLRLLFPFVDRLAPAASRFELRTYRADLLQKLRRAGIEQVFTPDHFIAMKAFTAIAVAFVLSRVSDAAASIPGFIAVAAGASFIPDFLLSEVRKARESKILRDLPSSVDVLSLSVEAGLEFLTAMQRLVEKGRVGPLRDELATILNDVRLGKTRQEALKAFAQRVELSEVSSFVSVLVQADMLGASIGTVLQTQAERMRVERFQRAEKAGAKATQKILVPLVLFIFPAVLIVIMGPVVLQFIYGK